VKAICTLLALILAGCVSAPPFQAIAPSTKFEQLGAVVQSPSESGWYLIGRNQTNVSLGKRLPAKSESLIANSVLFPFEYAGDDDPYLKQIMALRQANDDKARFTVISITNELIDFKNARCFSYKTISEDHDAKGVIGKDTQYLKTIGMVCRHPSNKAIAIQVEVSHRSPEREFPLSYLPMADQFIQSLTLINNTVR